MGDEPLADDLLELGGRPSRLFRLPGQWRSRLPGWRPSRGAAVFAAAALVIGLAAGYAAGDRHARGSAALPTPTPSAWASAPAPATSFSFAGASALTQDTGACSAQTAQGLQLGVQVSNQSTQPLTLRTPRAVLPLGGLKEVGWQWATCGALPNGLGQADQILMPGQSTWMTVTFKVQPHCPGPYPVQFSVGYLVQGKSVAVSLPGFPDLSQVPYSGCPRPVANGDAAQVAITSG
jgi:hypothetical protein